MPDSLSFDASFWEQPRPKTRSSLASSSGLSVTVVYEDEAILVVAKPAGLAVQPDKAGSDNLLDQLRKSRSGDKIFLVHRLDRPVAGLVVLAKSAAAQTVLTRQMARGEFRKVYRTIVSPIPMQQNGQLVNDLVKLPGQNISRVVAADDPVPDKKTARLSYQVAGKTDWRGQELAWLTVELMTGRHHQIRVQLSHAGCPIVNDAKYGGLCLAGTPGQIALQAVQVSFLHPLDRRQLCFQLPAPESEPWTFFESVTEVLGAASKL
ncbi:MAG: RluA family pseudouridine synthase [Clostridia bacterium]|nr:RluA family pseudouridine synthase [Clostridia bacterium]NCC74920.1 RluA family pseudouridine synthase [Clostridia bacterium]